MTILSPSSTKSTLLLGLPGLIVAVHYSYQYRYVLLLLVPT